MNRSIESRIQGRPAEDGAGVKLTRLIDPRHAGASDPFLMLDEFRSDTASDYIAGFPPHPHRGFETVTYMMAGRMRHRDNKGNEGNLGPGAVQWMTAARGIVHEEMPQQENGLMWGYQLWLNLPAAEKMLPATYQDIDATSIPELAHGGAHVRVIAGELAGVRGPVPDRTTAPLYLDIDLPANAETSLPVPSGHRVLMVGVSGSVTIVGDAKPETLSARQAALLGAGEHVKVRTDEHAGRVLLIAAKPLREPIAHYGPFVMNTREEVMQAVNDFQAGRF
ncbi:quercetin 2,3-dioxygenase [Ahniella affigens]|uniref:Quercetin 2,3-dioxygenase n=1 Tax=Ahniella affigens TaxID=2021234 RepID=A0A2P1PYN2_9GAMM|nr:pirin family protein [Ahniella affigens]AVP99946.1 quercetin 2,3-dioxygenase [Ahniella affigens]